MNNRLTIDSSTEILVVSMPCPAYTQIFSLTFVRFGMEAVPKLHKVLREEDVEAVKYIENNNNLRESGSKPKIVLRNLGTAP